MATIADVVGFKERRPDMLSGTPRAHAVDRWIYVFTASLFVAIILTGFIPDSIMKVAMVQSGARPPFPIVLHMHAVLMGSFMLLLVAQTTLVATGRRQMHVQLGRAAFVIVPALVVVGFILVPTMYHQTSDALAAASSPEVRAKLQGIQTFEDNIMLVQTRIGLLLPLFIWIGLRARNANPGLHKRMMILASAMPLGAGLDRIGWLPTTMPGSPLAMELYTLAALSPMFLWDVIRNRRVHEAYLIWIAINLPVAFVIHRLWDTPWWHATARSIMGV